jgi:lysozyme family protein
MLDNDMIRLTQKINMVIEFKEEYEKMTGNKLDIDVDEIEKMKKVQKNVGKNSRVYTKATKK